MAFLEIISSFLLTASQVMNIPEEYQFPALVLVSTTVVEKLISIIDRDIVISLHLAWCIFLWLVVWLIGDFSILWFPLSTSSPEWSSSHSLVVICLFYHSWPSWRSLLSLEQASVFNNNSPPRSLPPRATQNLLPLPNELGVRKPWEPLQLPPAADRHDLLVEGKRIRMY